HWGAVLGVEGEHPGAGGGACLLRKPGGLPLQRGAKHNPTVFSEIRYLHGVEMPSEQDLRRAWFAPVDSHLCPPFFCPGHLSPEKMTMSAGENGVAHLVGDVRAAFLRVVEVHEFGEVG